MNCMICRKDCSFIAAVEGMCLDCFDNLQSLGAAELATRLVKAQREVNRLQTTIEKMREAWFDNHIYSQPHERQWEDESAEQLRHVQNKAMKEMYDKQTVGILKGEKYTLTPRCPADMDRAEAARAEQ